MKQGTNGRCRVDGSCGLGSASLRYVPAHHDEGYVGIVGVPCAMGCATILFIERVAQICRTKDGADVAGATRAVAIDDTLLDRFGNAGCCHLFEIGNIHEILHLLQLFDGFLLHLRQIELVVVYQLVVEVDTLVVDSRNQFAYDVEYVQKISFALDMKIIFLTVRCVFAREGISAEGSATMEAFTGTGASVHE